MIRGHSHALFVDGNPVFFLHRKRLADMAVKARLPTMFVVREYAEAGGLFAYGPSYTAHFRRAAVQSVGNISMMRRLPGGLRPLT